LRIDLAICAIGRRRLAALLAGGVCLLQAGVAVAALHVAVISDLNGSYGSTEYEASVATAVARLVGMRPDLVISTGDMVAGQRLHPPLGREAVTAMWSAFHREVTDRLDAAGIPLAVTPGNHDASAYASFVMEREAYRDEWLRRAGRLGFVDRAEYPFHYAFAVDDVLFVSLDVTRVGALDASQMQWLDRVLTRHAARFRHRVAFGHLPVLPFAQGRETEVTADHALERLLQRHGVELYLSGHHHAFYPGFHGGVRHIGQACLGAGPRKLIGSGESSPRAITMLVFDDEGVHVSALSGPGFDQPVMLDALPATIRSRFGTLVRDDLRNRRDLDGLQPAASLEHFP